MSWALLGLHRSAPLLLDPKTYALRTQKKRRRNLNGVTRVGAPPVAAIAPAESPSESPVALGGRVGLYANLGRSDAELPLGKGTGLSRHPTSWLVNVLTADCTRDQ